MATVLWDKEAREFLKNLPKETASRIVGKIDQVSKGNVYHYLESIVNYDAYKIRVGSYRLFVDYDKAKDLLTIRTIRNRRNAYKRLN